MRYLFLLGFFLFIAFSCLKKKSIGPVPEIEFLEFTHKPSASADSGKFKIGYTDSDGDLFANSSADKPNLLLKILRQNPNTGEFVKDSVSPTSQGIISRRIMQPNNGYYKGKSIQGYVYLNEAEFRSSEEVKIVKFEVFMTDLAGNKSNVATSKTYTLTN